MVIKFDVELDIPIGSTAYHTKKALVNAKAFQKIKISAISAAIYKLFSMDVGHRRQGYFLFPSARNFKRIARR